MRAFDKFIKRINEEMNETPVEITDNTTSTGIFTPPVIDVGTEGTDDLVVDKATVMGEIHELLEKLGLDAESVVEFSKLIADRANVGYSEESEEELEKESPESDTDIDTNEDEEGSEDEDEEKE